MPAIPAIMAGAAVIGAGTSIAGMAGAGGGGGGKPWYGHQEATAMGRQSYQFQKETAQRNKASEEALLTELGFTKVALRADKSGTGGGFSWEYNPEGHMPGTVAAASAVKGQYGALEAQARRGGAGYAAGGGLSDSMGQKVGLLSAQDVGRVYAAEPEKRLASLMSFAGLGAGTGGQMAGQALTAEQIRLNAEAQRQAAMGQSFANFGNTIGGIGRGAMLYDYLNPAQPMNYSNLTLAPGTSGSGAYGDPIVSGLYSTLS